jgi:lipid A ethanolaminephosphotransferase
MLNFPTKPSSIVVSQLKLSLYLAISYCFLFNSTNALFKFGYYKADIVLGILDLIKDGFYILLANFVIFFGLSCNRFVLSLGTVFLFTTGAIASYALYFFKAHPTKHMLHAMFENELAESYEVISIKAVVWVIFCVAIAIGILLRTRNAKLQPRVLTTMCLGLFAYNIYSPNYKVLTSYFPIQYLHNAYLNVSESFKVVHKTDISEKFDFISQAGDDLVGVLVIGESARYDHFGINNYHRDTTPNLTTIPNLFSFKAQAIANLTYLSVPYMLSRVTADNIENANNETGFLSVLTKLGFDTGWIGTQSILKYLKGHGIDTIYDEVKISIIPGGSALYQMNAHDEVMLPYFDNFLTIGGRKFIVLHTSGSHWNYAMRYPKEYAKFTPTCPSETKIDHTHCSLEELINSYDNSIVYTDYILSRIIDKLKTMNAFMIYVSDHGESLGENGVYGHGSDMLPEQVTIPLIFWASDKFFASHKDLRQSLSQKQRSHTQYNHDYIFHSVLDCAGVQSDLINKELSVCRLNY